MLRQVLALLVFVLIVAAVAAFGAQFAPGEWYAAMNKPAWNPPSWVFGPVWTTLYLMMAFAAWLVWLTGDSRRGEALSWWGLQLVLNGAWSWLFFGLHRPGWALAEIGMLWLAIVLTIRSFRAIRPLAGWLLAPYLAWVTFAMVLNFTLWQLNGGRLLG
ncbi:MAG: TspO/MBR family protein [Xanthomonadales bacterium]|nr:TspO/MBR family protein [Xanthomonadales bacterium]